MHRANNLWQVLKENLGVSCILAITATATKSTAVSVSGHLNIAEDNIIRGTALPDNLKITVSCAEDKEKVQRTCPAVCVCVCVSCYVCGVCVWCVCPVVCVLCMVGVLLCIMEYSSHFSLAGPCAAAARSHLQLPVLHYRVLHKAAADRTCGSGPSHLCPHAAGFRR